MSFKRWMAERRFKQFRKLEEELVRLRQIKQVAPVHYSTLERSIEDVLLDMERLQTQLETDKWNK